MSKSDVCGVVDLRWTTDNTAGVAVVQRESLRRQVRQHVDQADCHTLKLIQKFIRSLDRG